MNLDNRKFSSDNRSCGLARNPLFAGARRVGREAMQRIANPNCETGFPQRPQHLPDISESDNKRGHTVNVSGIPTTAFRAPIRCEVV